jgi:predicted RNA binding protein YcfA (HicA-like mRNA interferase family)
MAIDHLDDLHSELPDIFENKALPPTWDDELLIVPIEDVEAELSTLTCDAPEDRARADSASFLDLEVIAVDELLRSETGNADRGPILKSFPQSILEALGGSHPGAPIRLPHGCPPPPDAFAFYLPFHYYHPTWWGVYLSFEGVIWLASDIIQRSSGSVAAPAAFRAARMFLYYHEAFHHKTECFATRLELTHRVPLYRTGFETLYQETFGTDKCLEEGLANASALLSTSKNSKCAASDTALIEYVKASSPGYRMGAEFKKQLVDVRNHFAEENVHKCFPHLPRKNPNIWQTAPYMFNGISNIKGRANYVIARDSPLMARLPFRPLLPPNKLVKKLKHLANLTFVRHGSNHDIYMTPSGKRVSIPRHPRDLGEGLLRTILRQVELDVSLDVFMAA